MKKCPACRSISPDEETTCGVCGESLENVSPMLETLDLSIQDDMAKELADERRFARRVHKVDAIRVVAGLSIGLAVLASGTILIAYEGFGSWRWLAAGFLCLPLGLWISASAILGGLGPSGFYKLWLSPRYRAFFQWWYWRGPAESEEKEQTDESEKAEKHRRTT